MKQQTYPDYKNWIPEWMRIGADVLGVVGVAVCLWINKMYYTFSYDGKRKLSKTIVEGTAEYVTLPEGGVGLDVGCGSGALTIACAKKNPQGTMVGIDRWGKEYMDFSNALCVKNAEAEGVAELKAEGYEDVQLIDTTRGKFIGRAESMVMDLAGSKLLVGTK